MDKKQLFQGMVYASAEASRLTFAQRCEKRSDQGLVIRLGKSAAGDLLQPFIHVPQSIESVGENFHLMESGLSNLVYFSPDTVLKVNIRTLDTDLESVKREQVRHLGEYLQVDAFLNDYMLTTSFTVERFMKRFAVFSKQQRIFPEKLFKSVEDMIQYRDDQEYRSLLAGLFNSITSLKTHTGFYPDILGANNLALIFDKKSGEKIVLLDSDPASPEVQKRNIPNTEQNIGQAIDEKMAVWGQRLGIK